MKNVYANGQFVAMFGGGNPTPEGNPYIVGMGNAYTALPVYSDENDILKIQFKFKNTDETTDNKMVIGSAFSGNSDYLLYMTVENGQPIYSYAVANNYTYIKAPRSTTEYDDIELGYDYMIVNGTTYTSQTPAKHLNHNPIYLFGSAYTGAGVFGEVKIYKNDVLTYDLVPSINSSGVACFKDVLNSDTEYLSAGAEYYYFKDGNGGSPTPSDDRIYLFKDGEWKNQDILSLYGYKTSIENGSLKCTGTHAGVVVDDVSGLDSSVTKYSVYLKVRAGNTNNYPLQTGRNVPTQNLYDIIHYGTNRYSFNSDAISSGTDYLFVLNALSNTDGVFLGTENYTDDNAYYYIDEIWLEETPIQVIVHS